MSWKKMIFGEKMPDKNDPQYAARYEKEVNAGRRFAKATKIDRLAMHVQHFANLHRKAFLVIVFGFVFLCFVFNLYRIAHAYNAGSITPTATQRQEQMLRERHKKVEKATEDSKEKGMEIIELQSFNHK